VPLEDREDLGHLIAVEADGAQAECRPLAAPQEPEDREQEERGDHRQAEAVDQPRHAAMCR
jgi:hypothetical protein